MMLTSCSEPLKMKSQRMSTVYFITHPDVVIDPATPVVDGDVAMVAHGGTGTLLLCHLAGVPISRDWDQPRTNGGNYFAFDLMTFRLLHGWRSIDTHVTSYQKREDRTK
jgi:broad specificity phosphatase PhoE